MNDDEITTLIKSLSRPHPSGGVVIERAAILATGQGSPEIIDWIISHAGTPEAPPARRERGLHGPRIDVGGATTAAHPTRFVLPAAALATATGVRSGPKGTHGAGAMNATIATSTTGTWRS